LREKLIDVSRSLSKSALSLQVRAGRGDSITPGIENRDLITVIALVVQAPRRSPFRIGTAVRPDGVANTTRCPRSRIVRHGTPLSVGSKSLPGSGMSKVAMQFCPG